MAAWRAAAIERLPELRRVIESADNVMGLWIQLTMTFKQAYSEPQNQCLIAAIYSYACWCVEAPRDANAGHDPVTAVAVGFFEDIPTIPAAREDMPRWFTYEDVEQSKGVFGHNLTEAAFAELLAHMKRNRKQYGPRPRDGTSR